MAGHDAREAHEWDERYRSQAGDGSHWWSGRPNGSLVAEVSDLAPGTALDVGCGEGADAIWLAARGWKVTAVDPSAVAIERARTAALDAGVDVTWVTSGLLGMAGGTGVHDLVSLQYAAIRHAGGAVISAVLAAVAPGGTLLYVHHDLAGVPAHGDGFDPADYVQPADVARHLDAGWEIEAHETRPRPGPQPPEARHVRDVVLRARRRTTAGTQDG